MQQLRVQVTLASSRILKRAQYSHAEYKRHSIVIRLRVLGRCRQCGWCL